mmetsp:Transcript_7932/g.11787  ORF Transcript_7932/g.11787 Transcript_7932/m.11787 type:complete len:252 (-) Transcript_7932:479-1234(-)
MNAPIRPDERVEGGAPQSGISDRSNSEAAPEASTTKRSFCGDLLTQTVFLTKKNVLVQGRSTNALLTQLFIGVIFLGMLRLMQLSQEANPNFAADYEELRQPTVTSVELPQRCTPHAWETGCFSFLAAPNGVDALGQYATTIAQQMATDAGFPGKGERFGYELMEDGDAVDKWIFENVNATPVAILFHSEPSTGTVAYSIQYNVTRICNVMRPRVHEPQARPPGRVPASRGPGDPPPGVGQPGRRGQDQLL